MFRRSWQYEKSSRRFCPSNSYWASIAQSGGDGRGGNRLGAARHRRSRCTCIYRSRAREIGRRCSRVIHARRQADVNCTITRATAALQTVGAELFLFSRSRDAFDKLPLDPKICFPPAITMELFLRNGRSVFVKRSLCDFPTSRVWCSRR